MFYNKINYIIKSTFIVIFSTFFSSCISENAEELFPTNDEAANAVYEESLKSILENKCINCHNFHLEGTNRYDNFEKTKASIGLMLERINADSNLSMPPDGSPQLTDEEKLVFQEFFDVLNSEEEEEEEEEEDAILLTFTAYKYPEFEERGGVSGTFADIEYQFNEDYTEIIDMLDGAEATIETSSVDIDGLDGLRSGNVGTYFFANFSSTIEAEVIEYDESEATIRITMNDNTSDVTFDIEIVDDALVLNGTIEDMNVFDWQDAYDSLETICGDFHMNVVWPDVDLQLSIPITQ